MSTTVPMKHIDSGKTADVHPDEVENWKAHGWRTASPEPQIVPPPPPPPGQPAAQKPTLSLKSKG